MLHRLLLGFTPERPPRMGAEEELAQGLVRRRVAKRPSDSVTGSSPALVSSMMEPIALTKPSPDAAGAGCTAVGSPLLKPNRARVGKEKPHGCPHVAFLGAHVLVGLGMTRKGLGVQSKPLAIQLQKTSQQQPRSSPCLPLTPKLKKCPRATECSGRGTNG